jgi:ribosome-associated translation inhibitor RaiA
VTFLGLPVDLDIERCCVAEARKLERYFEHITSCRVVVSLPHRHHQKGNLHHVRVELAVPGDVLIVDHDPLDQAVQRDWRIAVRDAFDRARRVLEDYARKLRGDVKAHTTGPRS